VSFNTSIKIKTHDEEKRILNLIELLIQEYKLDLTGLTIFTEIATGPYFYTPLIPLMANAKEVFALALDSCYGTKSEIINCAENFSRQHGIVNSLEIITEKSSKYVHKSDIITNSGFVRPIDAEMIGWMKPTAVIPLMWETWEFREVDLDLDACKQNNIVVLGTNEHVPPCDMRLYSGLLALKLLFELGLEVCNTNLLLIGDQSTLGKAIHNFLIKAGCCIDWFGSEGNAPYNYEQLTGYFEKFGKFYESIIVAEHKDSRCIIGPEGVLNIDLILKHNPTVRIGIIAGNINLESLNTSGLYFLPKKIRPFGYMSYQPDTLGPRPILELYTAGIKVGEAMSRARLLGFGVKETVKYALENSPAMDFLGENSWL